MVVAWFGAAIMFIGLVMGFKGPQPGTPGRTAYLGKIMIWEIVGFAIAMGGLWMA